MLIFNDFMSPQNIIIWIFKNFIIIYLLEKIYIYIYKKKMESLKIYVMLLIILCK